MLCYLNNNPQCVVLQQVSLQCKHTHLTPLSYTHTWYGCRGIGRYFTSTQWSWYRYEDTVLVPVFHLLLVQDCVGLLQGELQRERKPRDTKQGADWLLGEAAGRPLTMSLSARVMVRLVLPPFMIMAVFTSSTSLGARLSRKRLERLVLGFLWDDTGE